MADARQGVPSGIKWSMAYRILADLVVMAHFFWIVFLVVGFLPGSRYQSVKILHLGGLGFAVISQIFGWYCPLTHLEVWLRSRHDPELGYAGSFIIHYLEKVIYIEISPAVIFLLTLVLCLVSGWGYFRKGRRWHGNK